MGYRKVPVQIAGIGETALSAEPDMEQIFIKRPEHIIKPEDFERKLYVFKNFISKSVAEVLNNAEKDNALYNELKTQIKALDNEWRNDSRATAQFNRHQYRTQ